VIIFCVCIEWYNRESETISSEVPYLTSFDLECLLVNGLYTFRAIFFKLNIVETCHVERE